LYDAVGVLDAEATTDSPSVSSASRISFFTNPPRF